MLPRQVVLLTPPKSSHPTQFLSRPQSAPVSPLTATLMHPPASVANKRLTAGLSSLDATLTKNRGYILPSSQIFLPVLAPPRVPLPPTYKSPVTKSPVVHLFSFSSLQNAFPTTPLF